MHTLSMTDGVFEVVHSDEIHDVYEAVLALPPERFADVDFTILSIFPDDAMPE
ncbi:MAG: hypothetical protein KDI49_09310 [Gammaproteobacteria bacterium]|nr:hypothetical protein [Gammaproteobacteria bacterium]